MNIPTFKVEKLVNKPGNEMWRIGGGFHAYRGFFRIDLGSVGFRIVRNFDYCQEVNRLVELLTEENQRILFNYINTLADEGIQDPAIEKQLVVRGGSALVHERKDLYQKTWVRARELLAKQRTMR